VFNYAMEDLDGITITELVEQAGLRQDLRACRAYGDWSEEQARAWWDSEGQRVVAARARSTKSSERSAPSVVVKR
jgi:hypothetical protein